MKSLQEFIHILFRSDSYALVISNFSDFQIKDMNGAAREKFPGYGDMLSHELFPLSQEELKWYKSMPAEEGFFDFLPIRLGGEEFILETYIYSINGVLHRADCLGPYGSSEYGIHSCKQDICIRYCHSNGSGIYSPVSDAGINKVLKAALYMYAADRVYVVEVDPDIQCLADIYTLNRYGFNESIPGIHSIEDFGVRSFMKAWDNGTAFSDASYQKSDYSGFQLGEQLYSSISSWSYMVVPFEKQTGIRCFLCVDNVRRDFGEEAPLRYFTYIIANHMYSSQLRASMLSLQNMYYHISHRPENLLKINLLGKFTVRGNRGYDDFSGLSPQCGTLFVYLLTNKHRLVSARELAEVIWPEEIIDNPYAMIKNVAFRTKKAFEKICDLPVIVAEAGTYSINRSLEFEIDTAEFEYKCKLAANTSMSKRKRLEACKAAFELYTGRMLPNFESVSWLMTRTCYMQVLYIDMVRSYLELLSEMNEYAEMLNVAGRAMSQEALDGDIHLLILKTLITNRKKELAKNYYMRVKSQLLPGEDAEFNSLWAQYYSAR